MKWRIGLLLVCYVGLGVWWGSHVSGVEPTGPGDRPTTLQGRQLAINAYGFAGNKLASSIDLTQGGGLPPVGDQGSQACCVAWATGYAACTYQTAVTQGWVNESTNEIASPADLYAKVLAALKEGCNEDTKADVAMDVLVSQGVASIAAVPFNVNHPNLCAKPSTAGTLGIGGYHLIDPSDSTMIKRQLATGYVVTISLNYPSGLRAWGEADHKPNDVFSQTAPISGGHTMTIVGYDDALGAWKVMNSFGASWANHGFFWMSYSALARLAPASGGRYAIVADGGGEVNVLPSTGQTTVAFKNAGGYQYYDSVYNNSYLEFSFQLSHPMMASHAVIQYPDGSNHTAPVNAWVSNSYVYLSESGDVNFPVGSYNLTLVGVTSGGNSVSDTVSVNVQLGP